MPGPVQPGPPWPSPAQCLPRRGRPFPIWSTTGQTRGCKTQAAYGPIHGGVANMVRCQHWTSGQPGGLCDKVEMGGGARGFICAWGFFSARMPSTVSCWWPKGERKGRNILRNSPEGRASVAVQWGCRMGMKHIHISHETRNGLIWLHSWAPAAHVGNSL